MNRKAPGTHKTPLRKRLTIRQWKRSNPEKTAAHQAVKKAIERGELVRQPCACGSTYRVQAHHDDYSKPLEVRWLCGRCHTKEHLPDRQIARARTGPQPELPPVWLLEAWWTLCVSIADSDPTADVREVMARFASQEFPPARRPPEPTGKVARAGFFPYQLFTCIREDGERIGVYAANELDARCIAAGLWRCDPAAVISRYVKTIVASRPRAALTAVAAYVAAGARARARARGANA